MKVGTREFAAAINNALELFSAEVNDSLNTAIDETAKKSLEKIKNIGDYEDRTGKYRKSFRLREASKRGVKSKTMYSTRHQLTHLLENGHSAGGGSGRTRAFPHWAPTKEFMQDELPKIFAEELGK